jgi:nucleotide-binding universal stress UspA family protein
MFQHIVVPIDDSEAAWRAVPIAARLAADVDGKLDVVTVVDRVGAVGAALTNLRTGLDSLGDLPVDPHAEVLAHHSIAAALAEHVESRNGAMIVMSSHGHGRSAGVLGSVANDVLRASFGPIVVIGPHVRPDAGSRPGPCIVPLDGSPWRRDPADRRGLDAGVRSRAVVGRSAVARRDQNARLHGLGVRRAPSSTDAAGDRPGGRVRGGPPR